LRCCSSVKAMLKSALKSLPDEDTHGNVHPIRPLYAWSFASGAAIPIEERAADEDAHLGGTLLAPAGTTVSNPAFDVTPAANITAIVTEAGVHRAPFEQSLPVPAA